MGSISRRIVGAGGREVSLTWEKQEAQVKSIRVKALVEEISTNLIFKRRKNHGCTIIQTALVFIEESFVMVAFSVESTDSLNIMCYFLPRQFCSGSDEYITGVDLILNY